MGNRKARKYKGFASIDKTKQREIASKGGRAAHEQGVAHEFNSTTGSQAGKKGGKSISQNREHMVLISRRGVEARKAKREEKVMKKLSSYAG